MISASIAENDVVRRERERERSTAVHGGAALACAASFPSVALPAAAVAPLNPVYGESAALLEASVQVLYLGALLALLGAGSFLVVRQILVRRELENAAKELQERVRSGAASCEEYFELGAVMLRKKFFMMANKYLEQAVKKWDGEPQELAQVYNALGYSYYSNKQVGKAVKQYEKAVQIQPAYVTAWNNLGNALEEEQKWEGALKAYEEALVYDPTNRIAAAKRDTLKARVTLRQGVPELKEPL